MGDGEVIFAVADAGPIIHLSEVGSLPFLQLFGAVHIPDAVWSEIISHQKVQENDIKGMNNVHRHKLRKDLVYNFVNENKLLKLTDFLINDLLAPSYRNLNLPTRGSRSSIRSSISQ